ncbi:MAG: hypothetical protein AAF206_09535 [Bacteroidota bacterium]
MTYSYHDGSGNAYRLANDKLSYDPVKPAFSSSGVYDGGDPKSVVLTRAQQKPLIHLLTNTLNNTSLHIETRPMGSGRILIDGKSCVIGMRSPVRAEIEALLKQLLAQSIEE